MKTIADEIIEIQIKKFFKWVIFLFVVSALLYFGIRSGIGFYEQHKTQVAEARAYVADVREVIKLVESDAKR